MADNFTIDGWEDEEYKAKLTGQRLEKARAIDRQKSVNGAGFLHLRIKTGKPAFIQILSGGT